MPPKKTESQEPVKPEESEVQVNADEQLKAQQEQNEKLLAELKDEREKIAAERKAAEEDRKAAQKEIAKQQESLQEQLQELAKMKVAAGVTAEVTGAREQERAALLNEQLNDDDARKYEPKAFRVSSFQLRDRPTLELLACDESEAVRRCAICYQVDPSKYNFQVSPV